MVRALVVFAVFGVTPASAETVELADKVGADCAFKGFKLHGRVKVVQAHADLKVRIVDAHADLRVRFVDSFPNGCGRWKLVDSHPDFTVEFVESFPDVRIKAVESFPGVR